MFGGILTKIQSKLEEIDGQAAVQAEQGNQKMQNDRNSDEFSDEIRTTQDFETLMTNIQRARIQISSLEEQLKALTQENAKLEAELQESETNVSNLTEDLRESESQRNSMKEDIKSLEKKMKIDKDNYEKMQTNLSDMRMKLEKDLVSVTEKNTSLQHDIQIKANENTKLNEQLQNQASEIKILESDVARYREKAVESLTAGEQSSSVTGQLEVLEAERTRLKERYSRAQQKIAQLETAAKEIEEQMQNEIGEVKLQQVALENDLFRERTQNEALTHELGLVRSQLFASRESAESRFKAQIEAERSEHRAQIARMREEQTRMSSNSQEEKLIEANATIESLKSEKATLMLMLENQKAPREESFSLGVGISQRKKKNYTTLTSKMPIGTPHNVLNVVKKIDRNMDKLNNYLTGQPVLNFCLILWFFIVNLLYLFK